SLFARFIVQKAIASDIGTNFCNKILEKTLAQFGVCHKLATPYHPWTNGKVELNK
ncbi:DDE-type integrase/transposase/recombinase, partial [Vibrio vulnificus]|nr:DDE-type integrase/transposase/recombinase [Vibrio vulnificus]